MNNIKINKSKKIILILLLIILINPIKINALSADEGNVNCKELEEKCKYIYTEKNGRTLICYKKSGGDRYEIVRGAYLGMNSEGSTEPILNTESDCKKCNNNVKCYIDTDTQMKKKFPNEEDRTFSCVADEAPKFIVYRHKIRAIVGTSDGIYGFDNILYANDFANASGEADRMYAWVLERQEVNEVCKSAKTIDGEKILIDPFEDSDNLDVGCHLLSNETITKIRKILNILRILVPVIVIVYGSIDLAKAAIAQKEDEMKKAQNTFMKRIIIGVAFFFIPTFINIIINTVNEGNLFGRNICNWNNYYDE